MTRIKGSIRVPISTFAYRADKTGPFDVETTHDPNARGRYRSFINIEVDLTVEYELPAQDWTSRPPIPSPAGLFTTPEIEGEGSDAPPYDMMADLRAKLEK